MMKLYFYMISIFAIATMTEMNRAAIYDDQTHVASNPIMGAVMEWVQADHVKKAELREANRNRCAVWVPSQDRCVDRVKYIEDHLAALSKAFADTEALLKRN